MIDWYCCRSRKLSIDEIEAIFEETDEIKKMIEKDELEIEAEETDLDVLLDSCGILATRPTQVLNTLVQTRKTKSLDMLHLLSLEGQQEINGISSKSKSPKMPLRTMKDNVVAASMTRSLDFDDLKPNRRVVSEGFSNKQVKVGLPAFQEVLHQESMETSSISSDSDLETAVKPCETGDNLDKVKFTIVVVDETSQLNNMVEAAEEVPIERSQTDQQDTTEDTSQNTEEKEAVNDANAAAATLTTTDTTAEEKGEEDDEFDIILGDDNSNKQKRSMALFHPSMKMSLR